MNCIIVDDEKMARVIIKTLCNSIKSLNLVQEFSSAIEAIKYLNENQIDLIFLDIHMPGFSGLDFIKTLKNPPKIIFTTADPQFALKAFEYDFIVDYLLKPIELPRFIKAINKAEKLSVTQDKFDIKINNSTDNDFYVNIDRRLIKIDLPSIYLIEAKGDYINIKTDEKIT